ncbi:MAG TPA: c-type cytochrome [Bryobacteraceae bacterium]|jgi:thiosulfate dehydrogenase|nr:c-type cytochrome [Bryobacteraceae bacterium]
MTSSFTGAIAACALLGALTVGATLRYGSQAPEKPHDVPVIATEEYGKRLLAQTQELLGPDVADPKLRYISSRLSCGSCHLGTGAEAGTLSLPDAVLHYPRFSARVGVSTTIEDRINECMQRSMNGRPLPKNSPQMIAMAAYIHSLQDRQAASAPSKPKTKEPPAFKSPKRAADLDAGKKILEKKCAACHQADGSGLPAEANPIHGYVFPPLWGPDSFNDGAGMHRVLTAAKFIKAKMPLGRPELTDDEAYDVAGYINSQPRPQMPHLEADYPDKRTKPVDTGYGPFADSFPLKQHQFGPFQPIEAYYKSTAKTR